MVPLPLRRIVISSLSSIHRNTRTQDRLVPFWLKVNSRQNGLLFHPPTIPNGTFQIRSRTCSSGRGTSSKVRIAGNSPCSARCRHSHKLTPIT